MMAEAYDLSLLVALAALSFAVLRAAALRPTVLIAIGIAGVFCVGYVAGHITLPAGGWNRAGQVHAPAQWVGSVGGESAAVRAPSPDRRLIVKSGSKVSVDIFDLASAGVLGNRERVDVAKGASLKIAGWAADGEADAPCKALYVSIGKIRFEVPYGRPRADVAAYFHNTALTATGFSSQLPTGALPKGSNSLNVECLSPDAKTLFVLNHARTVVVR
jgi:hypothetical protein